MNRIEVTGEPGKVRFSYIDGGDLVKGIVAKSDGPLSVSDGFHTMEELYEHRHALFIALAETINAVGKTLNRDGMHIWKSRTHTDGTSYPGWFLMGTNADAGSQISYHLPDKYWERCDFATTLDKAPEWDGHTPADVIERLLKRL